jgi:septal ring factor EnvC (AmiA/AmiB activator)
LPVIRQRTAALRSEVEAGNRLRQQAERGVAALAASREELKRRRVQLARFEAQQRQRSEMLSASALVESDRALALGEEARELSARVGTLEYQARLRQSLAQLPGPMIRPARTGEPSRAEPKGTPRYLLPVTGRVVTGTGEISDAGVHARGLTFETAANAEVTAPASGRIVYAGRFRGYGEIVIIDHGNGWTSAITNLASLSVRTGDRVRRRSLVGRAGPGRPLVSVELRRDGRPFPIAPLLALG